IPPVSRPCGRGSWYKNQAHVLIFMILKPQFLKKILLSIGAPTSSAPSVFRLPPFFPSLVDKNGRVLPLLYHFSFFCAIHRIRAHRQIIQRFLPNKILSYTWRFFCTFSHVSFFIRRTWLEKGWHRK
ncbi:hypothetical protein, partial [Angelakisella massiliensis]|uniref:hypothetical protein n=1 Tax=Angelakisella massiliensis TaxID=1871018 RepID=UPI0024B0D4CC